MNYTLDDLKKDEKTWKEVVSLNEINLFKRFAMEGFHLGYEEAEDNAWILKTLVDIKKKYKFKTAKSIVLVGSGIYPYSMFDLHKQYPHINQVGLEIDRKRAILSKQINKCISC